jgi:hypothetical protein
VTVFFFFDRYSSFFFFFLLLLIFRTTTVVHDKPIMMEVDKDDILDLSAIDSGFLGGGEEEDLIKGFSLVQSPASGKKSRNPPHTQTLFPSPLHPLSAKKQSLINVEMTQVFTFGASFIGSKGFR